jgi:hypothetical protein
MMPAKKTVKKPSNVFNIGDRPRVSTPKDKRLVLMPDDTSGLDADEIVTLTLGFNAYGFAAGDVLICARKFNPEDITHRSCVIVEDSDGDKTITVNPTDDVSIVAVVFGFQRFIKH